MCAMIQYLNKEIYLISELLTIYPNINLVKSPVYEQIDYHSCLCSLDVPATLAANHIEYEQDEYEKAFEIYRVKKYNSNSGLEFCSNKNPRRFKVTMGNGLGWYIGEDEK